MIDTYAFISNFNMAESAHVVTGSKIDPGPSEQSKLSENPIIRSFSHELNPKVIPKVSDTTDELRILLIGKSGDGKSATGNTILGEDAAFHSRRSSSSVTRHCNFQYGERFGRKLLIVDSPGLCDTTLTNTVIKMELMRSLGFTSPGFHVIAFVLREGRFTRECSETKRLFFEWFGSNVNKHALIILTHWGVGDGDPAEYFNDNSDLKHFKETCGNRVVAFDNKGSESDKEFQVKTLLTVIDDVIQENKGTHFSTIAFRIAHKCVHAAETPVFQWLQQKLVPSKEENLRSTEEVKVAEETSSEHNFQSFPEELESAMKTETCETETSHTETVDKTNIANASALCSKEEKEELDDMLNDYEDVHPTLSEYKAARKKFTDNSFLQRFLKIYQISGLKRNTPAIVNTK